MTDAEQVKALLNDHDCLRAELDQVRRILLPHPDANYGEDPGCGCDMLEAVDAAELVAAEIKRLRADVAALRDERDRLRLELQTVADVWRVREVLVERDRLRVELETQRRLNLQLAERLAACSQALGRAAEKGRVCGCQTQGGVR